MKTLNQGQEISKFRKGVFDDGPLKTPLILLRIRNNIFLH